MANKDPIEARASCGCTYRIVWHTRTSTWVRMSLSHCERSEQLLDLIEYEYSKYRDEYFAHHVNDCTPERLGLI